MERFILIILMAAATSYGQSCGCDYSFNSSTTTIDGNSYSFQPGDTICISSGARGRIRMKNVSGSSGNPITVINCGGQVIIDPGTYSYGFKLQNCNYVHISGAGDGSIEYGFYIDEASSYAMPIESLSNHFEIDHVEIENSGNYAVYYKNDPTCDSSANKGFFLMEDCSFHDLKITNCNKGIRVGHIEYDIGVTESCGTLYPHGAAGLEIYNNKITGTTGGDGIRIYGAEGHIYNNILEDIAGRGITIGTHCEVEIEGNIIGETEDEGLRCLGSGKYEIYNNIFYVNGDESHEGIEFAFDDPNGDSLGNQLTFINNTVVSSPNFNFSILEPDNATDTCFIQNNIFCKPGFSGSTSSYFDPYLNIDDTTLLKLEFNEMHLTTNDLKFYDAPNNDYNLTHESPAINVSNIEYVNLDYYGNPRSLAGKVDAGAIEYIPERLNYLEQIPLQGLYVNDFKNIIGDTAAEQTLLNYAELNGFNYLVLYNLTYINNNLYDLTDPSESLTLANFIETAKTEYGIVQIAAVGEKDASFDKIEDYNDIYDGNWFRQIDVLNLEFEFWANTSGSTFSYYCTTYLTPNGYSCTTAGAYEFYLDQLELIDQRAINMGLVNEIYLGNLDDTMSTELAENCDRILLHHYRTSDTYNNGNSIYNYKVERIRAIAESNRKPAIMPIFSAMSYHMGPWLSSNTIYQPMDTWLYGQNSYDDDTTNGVQNLNIAGYQWYRYTNLYSIWSSKGSYSLPNEIEYLGFESSQIVNPTQGDTSIFLIYPKNFDSYVHIQKETGEFEIVICSVYNLQGQLVFQKTINSSNEILELNQLESGIYILKINNSNSEIQSEKIIKVNH